MIRKWIRAWLGIIEPDFAAINRRLDEQQERIRALDEKVYEIEYRRGLREGARVKVLDWEQLQADFAANPDNYKEN